MYVHVNDCTSVGIKAWLGLWVKVNTKAPTCPYWLLTVMCLANKHIINVCVKYYNLCIMLCKFIPQIFLPAFDLVLGLIRLRVSANKISFFTSLIFRTCKDG